MANRWTELEKMNALRQAGALTDEQFEMQRQRLVLNPVDWVSSDRPAHHRRSWPPLPYVAGGVCAVLLLGAASLALMFRPSAAPAPQATASTRSQILPATAQTTNSSLAAAFNVIYATNSDEVGADGSTIHLTPKQLVVLPDKTAALISEGVRDGGAALGRACHACSGLLRVDYVQWGPLGPEHKSPLITETILGDGWGMPPTWRVNSAGPRPTVEVDSHFSGQGCTSTTHELLTLWPTRIEKSDGAPSADCSAAHVGLPTIATPSVYRTRHPHAHHS